MFKDYHSKFKSDGFSVKAYGICKVSKRLSTFEADIKRFLKNHEINFLNFRSNHYPSENDLFDMIYDEKTEKFRKSNDRTII